MYTHEISGIQHSVHVITQQFVHDLNIISIVLDDERTAELLQWLTGSDQVPTLGYDVRPMIYFGHESLLDPQDATASYPVADTCSLRVRLPIAPTYAMFKERFLAAMTVTTFTSQ